MRISDWSSDVCSSDLSIRIAVRDWTPGNGAMQVLIGGPTLGLSSWAASLLHDLGGGRRLDMIIAYFSPAAGFLRRIAQDRKSVVSGKCVSVRVNLGGRRTIKKINRSNINYYFL